MTDEERDALAATRKQLAAGDIHSALQTLDKLVEQYPARSPLQRIDNARIVIREAMRASLQSDAKSIAAAWKSGEYDGSQQTVDEAIDSECSFSDIDDAVEYLCWSKNEGAYFEHCGGSGGDRDGIDWTTLAYYARREDLVEALGDLRINLSIRPPRDDEFWCEICEEAQDKEHRKDDMCRSCYEAEGNTLCSECSKWVATDDVDAEERCMDCQPPEEDEEEKEHEVAQEPTEMKSYKGLRSSVGLHVVRENGARLAARFDLRRHSPSGFECGYSGSGPAQLALAILADYFEEDERAMRYYQHFKAEVIAKLPQDKDWELTWSDMARAIMAIDRKHPALHARLED